MAAQFEELGDFLDDWLELPSLCSDGETRTFRIPSPSAEDGLRVDRITTAAARLALGGSAMDETVLNDEEERDLFRLVLGNMYDEILSQVGWTRFRHIAMTTMVWITSDRDRAATYWSTGGRPSQAAPNRAARRSRNSGSSGSATATTTRSRGSTSSTKAASRRSAKPKAAGSK